MRHTACDNMIKSKKKVTRVTMCFRDGCLGVGPRDNPRQETSIISSGYVFENKMADGDDTYNYFHMH